MRTKDVRASEKRDKELFDFARAYLSEAFPNPDRDGCPPDTALRALAFNPRRSNPAVIGHLAACSPCYRRYAELLAEFKSQREAQKRFSWATVSVWTKAHPVLVGTAALCLLLIAISGGFLLRGIRRPNAPPFETNQNPNRNEPRHPAVAYLPFSLDLSALSRVRGAEPPESGPPPLAVPGSTLDLTLTLPLASREGVYDLKLASKDGIYWSTSAEAHLQKGKTLIHVKADFSKMQPGDYDLGVESSTGTRLVQPISIHAASPSEREQKP